MKHERPKIEAKPREKIGSLYAKRLRRSGRLPGVIYGHKRPPVAVSVDEKEMIGHLRHGAHVLTLDVEGAEAETVLVKDLQFGFLGDNVIHVDFARVDLQEEVEVHVHLNFVGQPHAAAQAGAILNYDITSLTVTCRVDEIPEEIKVDLSIMGEGTLLMVGDVTLPPGVKAAVDADMPVAHISFVKREEEAVGEEVEMEAAEGEPEVITEAKEEAAEEEAKVSKS